MCDFNTVGGLKPMEKTRKVEAYITLDSLPNEEPYFSLRLSTGYIYFEVIEMAEHEIRELVDEIIDMLELNIEVNEKLRSLASKVKEE